LARLPAPLPAGHLDNARVLWARVFERNRRDVEEKSEQLKALGNMAALIAGFSLAAFMQVLARTRVRAAAAFDRIQQPILCTSRCSSAGVGGGGARHREGLSFAR
jgi:hypothetical protein